MRDEAEYAETKRYSALALLETGLNAQTPVVYDTIDDDGREKRVLNQQETVAAQGTGRLRLLRAGRAAPGSASIYTRDVIRELIEALSSKADYVIIDSPPLLALADAFPLALQADSVLVVARLDRTTNAPARDGYHYS